MKKRKEVIGKKGKGKEKVINDCDDYYDKVNKGWLPLSTSPIPHSLKYAFPQSFLQVARTVNQIMGGRPNYFQFKMSEPSGHMHH